MKHTVTCLWCLESWLESYGLRYPTLCARWRYQCYCFTTCIETVSSIWPTIKTDPARGRLGVKDIEHSIQSTIATTKSGLPSVAQASACSKGPRAHSAERRPLVWIRCGLQLWILYTFDLWSQLGADLLQLDGSSQEANGSCPRESPIYRHFDHNKLSPRQHSWSFLTGPIWLICTHPCSLQDPRGLVALFGRTFLSLVLSCIRAWSCMYILQSYDILHTLWIPMYNLSISNLIKKGTTMNKCDHVQPRNDDRTMRFLCSALYNKSAQGCFRLCLSPFTSALSRAYCSLRVA